MNLPTGFTRPRVILAVRIALLSFLAWYLVCSLLPKGDGRVVHDVSFPPGSGIRKLAAELESAGIIRSSWQFVLAARLRGQAASLKAGDYRFSDGMNAGEILRKLVRGEVDFRRFVLPEGYSIYQAAELLEQKGFFPAGEFLEACRDRELLDARSIRAASAEGYLYPATYNLALKGTARMLVSQMLKRFDDAYGGIVRETGEGGGLSRHEVVSLASLIEKEAVTAGDRPLISSVFHNRLRIGMPLQSDPTAIYGLRAFGGTVTAADVRRPSPYNTYLNRGLPPGPIGNPGVEALRAALQPARSDYIYFVARKDGTHQFSRTLAEHNRAVARYLKRK